MSTSSKRICFVTTLPVTLKTFVRVQTEYLLRHGWEVTWICAKDLQFDKELPDGVRYIPLPFKRGVDFLGPFRFISYLYRLFKRENFDLVQYSTPNAAFYASTAAWLAGTPVRLYAQWGIRYVGFDGFVRYFLKRLEIWCCRCSTVVEPDSLSNLEFAIQENLYPRQKGRVIWNGSACGINLKSFDIAKKSNWRLARRAQLGFSNQNLIIGFVGSIRRDKGCNELLGACRSFFDTMPTVRLLLIGDKHHYHTINEDLRNWLESSDQVTYIPPTSEIPQLMACMDIFALPSYREGFGSVIIEAEAMGVPVVVSDVPGPRDAMCHEMTGLIVPVKNTGALAIALQTLLGDANKRTAFSNAAVDFARDRFEQSEFMRHVIEDKERLVNA